MLAHSSIQSQKRTLAASLLEVCIPLLLFLVSGSRAFAGDTGACCLLCPYDCQILTEAECTALEGFFLGVGTSCNDCPVPADVPVPSASEVTPSDAMNGLFMAPILPTPISASVITVTVRNSCDDVVPSAGVEVVLTPSNSACPTAVLFGTTNSEGAVTLSLGGGGCVYDVPLAGLIKANGVVIRSYDHVRSSDGDANGVVDLADLVEFSAEFLGTSSTKCHDYDDDGMASLKDLILFAPGFVDGNHCP